jgi:hypothetical protein
MAVEEPRRIALHRAAADTWGEEVADTLVELVAPSGHELATRADIEAVRADIAAFERRVDERSSSRDARWDERFAMRDARSDERFTAMEARWDAGLTAMEARWDERLTAVDARWDERLTAMDGRLTAMDERWDIRMESLGHRLTATFERRIADAVTSQTRTLVFSQLAALVVIAGLAFGLR